MPGVSHYDFVGIFCQHVYAKIFNINNKIFKNKKSCVLCKKNGRGAFKVW